MNNNIAKITPPQKGKSGRVRIREVDVLRGLAIVLMITGHSFIVHPIDISGVPWCATVSHWIYTFHMELFFMLCGCVYYCSDFTKYIKKKFDRIAVPYLFFGFIAIVLHSIGLEAVNKQTSFWEGISRLLMYGGSYWFLYTLFLLFLIYPFVEKICRKPWMEFVFALICVAIIEFIKLPGIITLWKVVYYLPFFIMGRYLVKLLQYEKSTSHLVNSLLFITSLIIFIMADYLAEIHLEVAFIKYIRAFAMIFVVYVPVHYLIQLEDGGNRIACLLDRFLSNCSKYSLQLYLFNGFILVAIRTIIVSVLHVCNPVLIVLSIVAGNIIITLVICNYLLPRFKWISWLCGTGNRPWINNQ